MKSIKNFKKRLNSRSLNYRKSCKKFKKNYKIVKSRLANRAINLSKKSKK